MYHTLKLKFDESLYDQLTDFLFEHGITSFEEGETILNENGDIQLTSERSILTLRFEKEDDLYALLSNVQTRWTNIVTEVSTQTDDYLNAWKEFSKEVQVSNTILITPRWLESTFSDKKIKIILDPGYAFGSGSHETTILCARELENCSQIKPRQSLLDVGCGSGVLSIIGSKLGYNPIVGVDIDPNAIDASEDNARCNNISNTTFTTQQLNEIQEEFDVVVANILSPVLRELKSSIIKKLKNDGTLILSGILKTEVISVASYYSEFNFIIKIMNEWACLYGVRKETS